MASTYTTNLGIEKPGTGEQSGTWGTTANTNYDLIDQAINGIVQVTLAAAGSSGSPNSLAITNGTASDGRNKYIEFIDGGDLGATAYVQLDPNDAEKIVHMRNSLSGSRSVIVFQGTYNASNDFEIPAGKDVVLKFDGAGASATVTQVFVDLKLDALDAATVAATTVNATTVDTTNLEVTNIKAKDGTSAGSIADSTGVVTFASAVLTTADINGGTMDGVTIGGASTAAGSFTTVTASGRVTFGELKGTGATVVSTILDEDNMASNSATALATQQSIKAYVDTAVQAQDTLAEILANGNTTGANNIVVTSGQAITTDTVNETSAGAGVTIDSVVLKDGDVNGTIGQVTAKAANFTTMGASSNVTVGGTLGVTGATTLTGDLAVNTDTLFVDVSDDVTIAGYTEAPYSLNYGRGQFAAVSSNNYSGMSLSAHSDSAINGGYFGFTRSRGTLASPSYVQAGDLIGTATAQPYRLSGGANRYSDSASMSFVASQTHSATQNGTDITFKSAEDGTITLYERLSLESDLTVFNEDSRDVDFRVESDGNANMLFVDAGTNKVYVGTSAKSDSAILNVTADSGANNLFLYGRSGDNYGFLQIRSNDGTKSNFQLGANETKAVIYGPTALSSAERIVISTSETIFNDNSADQDFRVESDTNTHALFVDAGNNVVGVGTSATTDAWTGYTPLAVGNQFMIGSTGASSTFTNMVHGGYYDGTNWLQRSTNITVARHEMIGNASGSYHNFYTATNVTADTATTQILNLSFTPSTAVFNEDSHDIDFRVEGSNQTHLLHIDAGNDQVNIQETYAPTSNYTLRVGNTRNFYVQPSLGSFAFYNAAIGFSAYVDSSSAPAQMILPAGRSTQGGGIIAANYDGGLGFYVYNAGSESAASVNIFDHEKLTLSPTAAIFNENGSDVDFRVESDANTHMLFVDAGADAVGIGASTVTKAKLNIRNGGVDGTYENVLAFQYSGNANENNIIGSSVSSAAGASGIYIGISDGGGASTTKNMLEVTRGAVIVNNDSQDADFRVESDANNQALFLDASDGFVKSGVAHYVGNTSNSLYSSGSGVGLYADNAYSSCGSHIEVGTDATTSWASMYINRAWTSGEDDRAIQFAVNGSGVGYVNITSSGTVFATSSDRRLKTDIQPIADATDKLMAMNPIRHKWIAQPDGDAVHGFIAQEMQEIVPEAVSGNPDSERMMAMDYGRITPILVAALQKAVATIETLEARVAALEAK